MKMIMLLTILCIFPVQFVFAENLNKRVDKLEKENWELKQRLDSLENQPKKFPTFDLEGFADVTYRFEKAANSADDQDNHFALGQLDLFITSALHERVDVLSETVFEFETATNEAVVDPERLWIRYTLSDLLKIKLGRMHTATSYWNTTYHHGQWLQTSIERPDIIAWEDEGGFLPQHGIGLEFAGRLQTDPMGFDYLLGVYNGRGRTPAEITNVVDHNAFKALSLMLRFSPTILDGFSFGFSGWYDQIPSNPTPSAAQLADGIVARAGETKEAIINGHLVYQAHHLSLTGEFFYIFHEDEATGIRTHNYGGYGEVGYQFSRLKPYVRFDYLNPDGADTYFAPNTADVLAYHLGFRWDIVDFAALKLEYALHDQDGRSLVHSGIANVAFHF